MPTWFQISLQGGQSGSVMGCWDRGLDRPSRTEGREEEARKQGKGRTSLNWADQGHGKEGPGGRGESHEGLGDRLDVREEVSLKLAWLGGWGCHPRKQER